MRITSIIKGQPVADFFRLCLGIIVSLTLAMGGMALTPRPVQAAPVITNPNPPIIVAQECVTFTTLPLTYTSVCQAPPCPTWPPEYPYFWQASGSWPTWLTLNTATGELTGCPDVGALGYTALIGCTSTLANPVGCPGISCVDFSAGPLDYATITIVVLAAPVGAVPPCLTINPTVYPAAWEGMPYTITLTATPAAGVGPLNWTATGLPAGLVLDINTGILSGIPGPGTCGPWTVMVTCTDTGVCPGVGCCAPVTAPLSLYVDCWANYYGMITTYYTTACDFLVNIGPGLAYGTTNVVIDGNLEATLAGNGSETFTSVPCESHLVVVNQIVQGADPKTRYACIGSNQKWVSDIDNIAYFDYAPEMWIDTGSDPAGIAQPPNAGFYALGANFSSSAPSPVESSSQPGTKYLFRDWSLPDGSMNPNRDLVFTVNKAGTALARYDTYYLLSLVSEYPQVSESSWELKDSTATWDLALQAVPMPNIFGAIGGVMRPDNDKGSHLMNSPYTQEILWKYDFTVPIILGVVTLLVIAAVVFFLTRRRVPSVASAATTAKEVPAPRTEAPATAAETKPVVTTTAKKKALRKGEPEEKAEFCPKCGTPVGKDADFCKKCGKKLE